MRKTAKKIIHLLSKSETISRLSKKIVDYSQNENNCEIESNGELDFIKKNKQDFKIIFDVGANVGEWTDLVSKIAPETLIYSFEPSKQTFKTLSERKFGDKISIHNIGLGDKNETKNFFIHEKNSTLNSAFARKLNDNNASDVRTEKVNFETLDSFCMKNKIDNISFLKIDTEGNESSVLMGAQRYVKEGKINAIQFEYGGTYIDARILLKDIFKFFENTSYSIFKLKQNGLQACPAYTEELENFQYANYVAILKKI
jgi:FkbM family methyltransferase